MKIKDLNKPLAPEEPISSKFFIQNILDRLKIDLNAPQHVISVQWPALVGENLAKISKFNGIENNTIKVKCVNSSAAALFRMNSKEVLKRIKDIYPDLNINKINVRM